MQSVYAQGHWTFVTGCEYIHQQAIPCELLQDLKPHGEVFAQLLLQAGSRPTVLAVSRVSPESASEQQKRAQKAHERGIPLEESNSTKVQLMAIRLVVAIGVRSLVCEHGWSGSPLARP